MISPLFLISSAILIIFSPEEPANTGKERKRKKDEVKKSNRIFPDFFQLFMVLIITYFIKQKNNPPVVFLFYLFTQVGAFLDFFNPGFFLSTDLGSLFKNPFSFKTDLDDGSSFTKTLAIPKRIASAWALTPEPLT